MRRHDGVYRWFHARVEPRVDEHGKVVRWYGLITDVDDRKRAEDSLRKSEQSLSRLIDTLPAMAWRTSPDGDPEYINRRLASYTGKRLTDLANSNPRTVRSVLLKWKKILIHPDDVDMVSRAWARAHDTGTPYDVTTRVRQADGTYRWFQMRAEPMRDDAGQIIHWYAVGVDVDDRKQAEEALREAERRAAEAKRAREVHFREIVDGIPGHVIVMTATGEVEFLNQQVLDYFGRTLQELKNWTTSDVVHPEDLPQLVTTWMRSVETGDPYDVEFRGRRADGIYRWFHTRGRPVRDVRGDVVRWYLLETDIEEQKRAEEAVRTSQQSLSRLIEALPAMVWRTTPNGEPDYINHRLADYLGSPMTELTEQRWRAFLHPDDVDDAARAWARSRETEMSFAGQYRLRRADGAYRWFQAHAEPLRNSDGRIVHWYGVHVDIDDSKRTEEALRATQAQLSRASEIAAVSGVAASIAHEISQPLAAMVANGHACQRWLSADPPNLERARLAAERIVRDGDSAAEV
ncbi:MAG TPA: PAS domain-containing protein, partial [Candidatus Dormibacteraeota bacterium]|nr:PAS domain-containing protein [Candidatus Dormibacteraeota bacterium]